MATIIDTAAQAAAAAEAAKEKALASKEKALAAKEKAAAALEKLKGMKPPKLKPPKGLGGMLVIMLGQMIKQSGFFEKAIDLLIKKLTKQCPKDIHTLKQIIKKKNRIQEGLTVVNNTLNVAQNIGTSLTKLIGIIEGAILAIDLATKVLPSSVPPGVGIPVGGITSVGQFLNKLKDEIKGKTVTVAGLTTGLGIINHIVQIMITKLEQLDSYLESCLIEQEQNGVLSKEDLDDLAKELTQTSFDSSNFQTNKDEGKELLNSLDPSSNDPFFYKTFRLTLQNDPDNMGLMLSRRGVVAVSAEQNMTLKGDYSFSSSTEILIKEMKFRIDQIMNPPPTFLDPKDIPVVIPSFPEVPEIEIPPEPYDEYKKGVYWKYNNHPSVFYDRPEGWRAEGLEETVDFGSELDYKVHRGMHGFPSDFSQIEQRGPKPGYDPDAGSSTPLGDTKKYYSSRQGQDLSDIALKNDVTVSTLESLNPVGLNPNKNQKDGDSSSFYKNPRKANKKKPDKGSNIRYK